MIMVTFTLLHFRFFQGWDNVKNFRFDIFLAITQEPQDIWKFWPHIWNPWLISHKTGIFLWNNILHFFSKTNKLEKYGSSYLSLNLGITFKMLPKTFYFMNNICTQNVTTATKLKDCVKMEILRVEDENFLVEKGFTLYAILNLRKTVSTGIRTPPIHGQSL